MSRRLKGEAGVDVSARSDPPSGLVTFLFTDIEGSTRLAEMLGGEYRSMLHEHRRVIRGAFESDGGIELFTEGDGLFVAFSDAAAAIRSCVAAQVALASHPWPSPETAPRVRMGLHTGFAEPYAGEYASIEVHRAARIATAAHGGQVLCSGPTARLVRERRGLPAGVCLLDLGLHRLRGFGGRERLFQLVAPGLERGFPRPRTDGAPAHNLPVPADRFVGRRREREELRGLLADHRLVTVVGPGGVGKTRLVVETAGELVDQYPDGVWFVDVSSTSSLLAAAGVAPGSGAELQGEERLIPAELAVATALGTRREPGRPLAETIAEYLASRCLMLILDTCDADSYAARRLARRLVAASGSVTVLATSREPIGVAGEVVWRLAPLGTAEPAGGGLCEAVELLAERASAARGGHEVTPAETADLCRVANALDGLPLALELAAARLRVLTVAQLAARIDDALGVLDASAGGADRITGGGSADGHDAAERHRTIRGTITWSYRRLNAPAAALLRRLSVFAGPVDLPAIEWLHDGDPLDPLATLVDKSLLQVESGPAGARYRMLDAIRGYAVRRLVEAGEEALARDRHVSWCLHSVRVAQTGGEDRAGRALVGALSLHALDPLIEEVRAALRWTVAEGSPRRGLAIVGALDPWWRERGLSGEGRSWLVRLHERVGIAGEPMPDVELAEAYRLHSLLAAADGNHSEALWLARRAEELARRAGYLALMTRIRAGYGGSLVAMGRLDDAERVCRETIAFAQAAGVASEALHAGYALAELLWRRGELDEASDLLATARPAESSSAAERARRSVDLLLGLVALSRKDVVAAHEYLVVALRSLIRHGFSATACDALSAMAVRCALGGDPGTAARLFGAAEAGRARLKCAPGGYAPFWAEHHGAVRAALGDGEFDAAYAQGGELDLSAAAALALAVEHPDLVLDSCRF